MLQCSISEDTMAPIKGLKNDFCRDCPISVRSGGKLLVSFFGCAAETATIEFEWKCHLEMSPRHRKGIHLGRYLIQAFELRKVPAAEAYEIVMQIAKDILSD